MDMETDSAPHFLREEFDRRVRANPRYSLRAFARDLGTSAGALSEVLRGRRPLSHKVAGRFVKALGLGRAEANVLYSFIESVKRSENGRDTDRRQLNEDIFHLLAEWHHFAILNLMDTEGFLWEAGYIAKRLGLTKAQADLSMRLLLKLGLVKKSGSLIVPAHDFVLSTDDIPSAAVRAYHQGILEKARQALDLQSVNERDITGIGFAVDPAHIPRIKKEISDFQDQLSAKFSRGKRREVYFLETALFRLSKGEGNE